MRACSVAQSCPTLCDPWTVARQAPLSLGFFQSRILEWVATSSSQASFWTRDQTHVSPTSPVPPGLLGGFFTRDWQIMAHEPNSAYLLFFFLMTCASMAFAFLKVFWGGCGNPLPFMLYKYLHWIPDFVSWPAKPKIFTVRPFTAKFADPWCRTLIPSLLYA